MTNLNHYSVHYTMHMVMENRNGRNPGKHFFLLLFANTNSVPHGLLYTALLGKKNITLLERIVFPVYQFMACFQLNVVSRCADRVQPVQRGKDEGCLYQWGHQGCCQHGSTCIRKVTFSNPAPAQSRNKLQLR